MRKHEQPQGAYIRNDVTGWFFSADSPPRSSCICREVVLGGRWGLNAWGSRDTLGLS